MRVTEATFDRLGTCPSRNTAVNATERGTSSCTALHSPEAPGTRTRQHSRGTRNLGHPRHSLAERPLWLELIFLRRYGFHMNTCIARVCCESVSDSPLGHTYYSHAKRLSHRQPLFRCRTTGSAPSHGTARSTSRAACRSGPRPRRSSSPAGRRPRHP